MRGQRYEFISVQQNSSGGERMRPLKRKISITLDEDLLEIIKTHAEQNDRSVSQYINLILKKHMQNEQTKKYCSP